MKKWLMLGLIGIGVITLIVTIIFLSYSDFNQNWKSCENDKDCIFVTPTGPCYSNCGDVRVINKGSSFNYRLHYFVDELINKKNYYGVLCECTMKVFKTEPSCNQEKVCYERINCEKTCDLFDKIGSQLGEESFAFYLNQSGCECDFS